MASLSAFQTVSLQRICTSLGASHLFVHIEQAQSEIFPCGTSWNVRTLLDAGGPVETARQNGEVSVMDERKIDQLVSELDRSCSSWCVAGDQMVWA